MLIARIKIEVKSSKTLTDEQIDEIDDRLSNTSLFESFIRSQIPAELLDSIIVEID